jgi:hypothetical protein
MVFRAEFPKLVVIKSHDIKDNPSNQFDKNKACNKQLCDSAPGMMSNQGKKAICHYLSNIFNIQIQTVPLQRVT